MLSDVSEAQVPTTTLRPLLGHVDQATAARVYGWATGGDQPLTIEVWFEGTLLKSGVANLPRPDVGDAFPDEPHGTISGFNLSLPPLPPVSGLTGTLDIRATRGEHDQGTSIGSIKLYNPQAVSRALSTAEAPRPGNVFPRDILNIVEAFWPGSTDNLHDEAVQENIVANVQSLLRTPRVQSLKPLVSYARFLRATWSHFQFVANHFPTENANSDADAKDSNCRANSPQELMSIAHQLYVLKSYGVPGDFAEFGCFKGFSSSMLSYACHALGVRMHIFDSFEGLPPSGSSFYEAGDFAGSLDEVTANIATFGAIDSVEFHKGFFSHSLARQTPPDLMCLWMDVDLEVSAIDMASALDQLAPAGTLFSHECVPEFFQAGKVVAGRSVDNPIPPILDKFGALGHQVSGRFIYGNTGALWATGVGTPVLSNTVLIDLCNSI